MKQQIGQMEAKGIELKQKVIDRKRKHGQRVVKRAFGSSEQLTKIRSQIVNREAFNQGVLGDIVSVVPIGKTITQ